MTIGVGASGHVGVAVETTPGTYVAPTHFMLLRSENFTYSQDSIWRRPLRGIADIAGVVPGNSGIEGDMSVEVTEDILPQLLRAARMSCVKTGAGPFVYTFTPTQVAVPAKTMSVTVTRNGVAFGFTGVVISRQEYTLDNGLLVATFGCFGLDEATQSVPVPTYVLTSPYGAGQYSLEIPTATPVTDADTYTLTIDDNGENLYRIRNTTAARYAKFGERSVELNIERDFFDRADFDAFKALTAQAILLKASKDATHYVQFEVKSAIKDTYEITGLSGQADLIRAGITYQGVYNAGASKAYEIVVSSDADVTIP